MNQYKYIYSLLPNYLSIEIDKRILLSIKLITRKEKVKTILKLINE